MRFGAARRIGLSCGVDFDTPIRTRTRTVRDAIAEAEQSAGRQAGSVRLLAISKTQPAAAVRAAHGCGVRDFGENYLQEALPKIDALAGLDIAWHFVGAVQSNKARDIARRFHWVHTIDREKVAARIDAAAERPVDVCLQVNIDAEPQKAGVAPDALPELAQRVAALPNLRLRGLMAIPRPVDAQAGFSMRSPRLPARIGIPFPWACRGTSRRLSQRVRPSCASALRCSACAVPEPTCGGARSPQTN